MFFLSGTRLNQDEKEIILQTKSRIQEEFKNIGLIIDMPKPG